MRPLASLICLVLLSAVEFFHPAGSGAQSYLQETGSPAFAVNIPVPNGYINIANGNLHLEFSLSTLKQRGQLSLNERLVYDSRIWKIIQYNHNYWWPLNIPNSAAGWRFVKGNEAGTFVYNYVSSNSNDCGDGNYSNYYSSSMTWTDPSGTAHLFDALYNQSYECDGSSGQSLSGGYATDASGYQVADDGNGNPVVKDGAGTEVYPQVIDRFGNYYSPDGGADLVDDLGRTPVITTQTGNQTFYDVLAPNGPISNNGTRVRYTVTMEQLALNTGFGQQAVVEYQNNGNPPGSNHPNISAIQSIQLPDGSSYQFNYDSYGAIQSVTLPTGGLVSYGWTNFQDSYQNVNHWVGTETIAGGTTNFTPAVISNCSSGGTGCQENVTMQRPSGDQTVYTLTLHNGAWDTATTVYAGPASSGQAKQTDQTTYDFATLCTYTMVCGGAQYITKSNEVTTLPDANLATQVQTFYTNPRLGQITSVGQWDYYPTGSNPSSIPTRQTNYQYSGLDLSSEIHLDVSGNPASATTYTYTPTATATSGIVGHGTANAGGPYLTSVTASNNAPAGLVTSSYTYEDTGALLTAQDANSNPVTTYKYDPTHTFMIEVDKPNTATWGTTYQHVSKVSVDSNSGAILSSDDENSVAQGQAYQVQYSYEPVGGRLQKITYPKAMPNDPTGGSQTYAYPSSNEVDVTIAQTATVNVTTTQIVDGYGRASQTISGSISSTQGYDSSGRPYSITNPTNGAGATNGTTYMYYDALNRLSSVQNPDGSTRTMQVTGNAALATDESGHQGKQVFNAFGELTSVFESDPNDGALGLETDYQRDGLGNVICVEQHGNTAGTGCTASPSSDATSAWRVRRFFYNSLSQLKAAGIPEHTFLPSAPANHNCGIGTGGNQWTDCYYYDLNGNQTSSVDNRGVTRAFTYDALNRPLIKTSPNGTTQDLAYDATTNGVGYLAFGSNDVNAAAGYGYDTLGRLISESSCRPSNCFGTGYVAMTAAYDLTGNRISITYPDGRVVASSYDMLNRLSTVNYQQWGATIIGSTYWTAASYAPPGLLQTANYGNGVQMQAGFNSRLSLTSLSYQSTSPTPPQTLFSKNYQWDQNATNLLGEIDQITTKQRQFGYDNLNRLVSAEDVAVTAAAATGTVEITGFEGFQQVCDGGGGLNTQAVRSQTMAQPQMPIGGCTNVYDTGSIYITVGGYTVSAPYHRFSTSIALANALNALLNAGGSPVAATVSGSTITLTAKTAGLSGDYPLSYSTDGDFDATFSGSTMMGGQSAQPIPGGLNDQYALDAWGNLSQMGGTSGGFSQPINQQNQVSTFSYDAAGRLLNDYVTSYSYDDDGMLLTSSDGTSYAYDALGFRAQDSQGGVSKEYYYFGGQLVATLNPATAAWTDMIYAGDQKIAVVAGNQTAPPVYLLPDHLGSEAASVDSNGNLLASLDYTPFGQVISGSSTDTSIFTGLERDQSGLDHATFRQYSSNTGRWTVPDPNDGSYQQSDPQSLNRYVYSRNNPLAFTDPTGLQQGTNGDPPISGGGGDCPLCDDFINFVINGIGDLIGQAPQFTGNAPQQAQGKSLRRQITNRNPNAPDNPNDSMGRGSSGGVSSGYFGGIFYINGDPSHAPNKACSSQPSTGFYTNKQFQADAGILSNELGVPANLVMTVAGAESTYGTSRFATQGNNYFGMHAGATGSVGPFAGNPIMAAFPSGDGFLLSGQSFVHAVRPLLSGLKNPADPTQFFTAIHAKFGVTTPNYVRTMVGNAGMATIRMQCP